MDEPEIDNSMETFMTLFNKMFSETKYNLQALNKRMEQGVLGYNWMDEQLADIAKKYVSNEGNGSENQQDDSSQQHAIQGVISLANQMYGEGDWRIASVIDATTPSGEACWYIGAINYSKSQSPTYYFYSSDSFTYADEEVNGYYNN